MKHLIFIPQILLFFIVYLFTTKAEDSSSNGMVLPHMYGMDNFKDCEHRGGNYCEVKLILRPKQIDSQTWKHILGTRSRKYFFDRSELFRAVCVQHSENGNIETEIKSRFNLEISNYSLEIQSVKLYKCKDPQERKWGVFQLVYVILLLIYGIFVLFATIFGQNPYIQAFSLTANHTQLFKPISNPNYQKLKSIQGIRTYSTILIIFGHTYFANFLIYSDNPEYFEYDNDTLIIWLYGMHLFIVQTFYLITGWLFYVSWCKYLQKGKIIGLSDMVRFMAYRILRMWPSLIFTVSFVGSGIISHLFNGNQEFLMDLGQKNCQKRWWSTVFFFQNFYSFRDMCLVHTWYLSADLQIFLCTLLILMVIDNLNLPVMESLLVVFTVQVTILMVQIYINNFDDVLHPGHNDIQGYNMFEKDIKHLNIWYTSAVSNMPTFTVGLIFGKIYLQKKEAKYFDSLIGKMFWAIGSLGLPVGAIYLAKYTYGRITNAFLGGLLKPMYSTGIAIAILVFSEGIGGIARRVCEFKFTVYLANVTFCVYLFHMGLAFEPIFSVTSPVHLSTYKLLFDSSVIIAESFVVGYVMTLVIELPFRNLSKIMIKHLQEKKFK